MDYFFIVKVVVVLLLQEKCSISLPHDITVNTHVTMGIWHCPGIHMSQWVGDIVQTFT